MHTDRTDTTERQMCAAAQADVYCSPAYSCDGCGRTFPEPPQMWNDRCGWCRWGTPDGLPPTCRHCGLATGTTDPCCSASLGLSDDTEAAEPDYWQSLAVDLRRAADRVASLAGTPAHVSYVTVGICAGLVPSEAPDGITTVDAIAAAFGAVASTGRHNGSALWEHRADARVGEVVLSAFAVVPKPASVEDELRAEVAALRAQLAEGGAR
ncbi:hypothetical protein [Salinispora arenicola]|uniref:hypothetical protein n=1 Tax=Salinispora arenicola TaxID=168697 RepID=UPI000366E4A7|nr:hypothetical protein [Salinispora arenicola]